MVAAVAPPTTPAGNNVQETTHVEKKKEAGNVQNYGGLPPAEKLKVVRKMRTMEITSRYKTATTTPSTASSSPLVAGRTNPSRNPSPLSRNPSPLRQPSPARQPSPSSRQPFPVRSRTTTSSSTPESHVRHPSPNLGRSSGISSSNAADVTKRAFSAERRRPWPAATPSETKASSTTTDGLHPTTKPRPPQSRTSELWPSAKQTNGDNVSDNSHSEDAKEKDSTTANQTLKPTGNGARNRTRAAENASPSPLRKGSPVRRQSIDQTENARPPENSHSKPEQQRWPGMSTGKVFSGPMSRSVDLTVDKEQRPLVRSSSISGTPSSRMKATVSRSLGPAAPSAQVAPRRNPTPTRGRPESNGIVKANVNVKGNGNGNGNGIGKGNGNGNGAHPSARDHATHFRRLSQDSVASLATENMSDTESVSSGGSGRVGRGTTVPARVWQDMNNRLRRFSEGDRTRSSEASELPVIAPVKTIRRTTKVLPNQSAASMLMNQSMNQSMNGSTTSAWALSPGRVNSSPSTPSSPSHSKGSSPLRGLPSPQRSRPAAAAAALAGTARSVGNATLSFGIGRGRKTLTQQEEAQLLRILHNRWLQWRFVNARAEAVTSAQKAAAEVCNYVSFAPLSLQFDGTGSYCFPFLMSFKATFTHT